KHVGLDGLPKPGGEIGRDRSIGQLTQLAGQGQVLFPCSLRRGLDRQVGLEAALFGGSQWAPPACGLQFVVFRIVHAITYGLITRGRAKLLSFFGFRPCSSPQVWLKDLLESL